ncbi:MAG TPA: hypothetical protein VFP97_02080, partial [Chitinophagaceae bacterium]|nr:hypothetical protein [Chitinophagaceae bacterium]
MNKLAVILSLCFILDRTHAQSNLSFQHLNTANGLSYIGATNMCTDQRGNVWIATGNGLNMFNGKTVEKYFASEHPEMQNSNVLQVLCDSNNNIWVLTVNGYVSVLDKYRQFHRVSLYDSNQFVKTLRMLKRENSTICLYTAKGNYTYNNTSPINRDSIDRAQFSFLPIRGFHQLSLQGRSQVFNYDENHYLLVHREAFIKVSFKTNTVERKYMFPDCRALIKWNENELMVFDQKAKEPKVINLVTEEVSLPFKNSKDQFGKMITGNFLVAEKISASKYLFGIEASGVYIYDVLSGNVFNYRHSFSDPASIA